MPLPVIVGLFVLAVIALVGVAAYVIDESEERLEGSPRDRDHRAES